MLAASNLIFRFLLFPRLFPAWRLDWRLRVHSSLYFGGPARTYASKQGGGRSKTNSPFFSLSPPPGRKGKKVNQREFPSPSCVRTRVRTFCVRFRKKSFPPSLIRRLVVARRRRNTRRPHTLLVQKASFLIFSALVSLWIFGEGSKNHSDPFLDA